MGKPQIEVLKEIVIPTPKINLIEQIIISKSGVVKKMNYQHNYVDISPPDSPNGQDFVAPTLNILESFSNEEDSIMNELMNMLDQTEDKSVNQEKSESNVSEIHMDNMDNTSEGRMDSMDNMFEVHMDNIDNGSEFRTDDVQGIRVDNMDDVLNNVLNSDENKVISANSDEFPLEINNVIERDLAIADIKQKTDTITKKLDSYLDLIAQCKKCLAILKRRESIIIHNYNLLSEQHKLFKILEI